jgi:AraC-like DNA-binding protein
LKKNHPTPHLWSESGAPIALSHWQMCVWQQYGKTNFTIRGPETKATRVPVPGDTEFFGIVFKVGTFMPYLPPSALVDTAATLPDASSDSFWLQGTSWQFPDFENVDTFIDRLAREGMLTREPIVQAALQEQPQQVSVRSIQRRFSQVAGITHSAISQIERARHAIILLRQGTSILDTVEQAGYADQPHLTRSLKHFIGQTPAQILQETEPEQLSFLFKTDSFR